MPSQRFRAALLLTALAIPFSANSASAIVVDGNLTDLITASASIDHGATASESGTDAGWNGFDITNAYLFYDTGANSLYVGFQTNGPVGDSCNPNAPGGLCAQFWIPAYTNPNFDGFENVQIQVDIGNSVFDADSIDYDSNPILGNGSLDQSGTSNGIDWAVSETHNGVEFGLEGINLSFTPNNPLDVSVRLLAGSGTNPRPEDELYISATLVPIPAAVWLFGSGLAGLAAFRRVRR